MAEAPICVVLAVASGTCMTLSAVALAFPAQRALQRDECMATSTKVAAVLGNLLLTGCAILLNIIAVGYGPVALATPLSVGSNLLSNMVLQSWLGIAKYTKNMVVGTLVLAAAVIILTGVGPGDVLPDTPFDDLLVTPVALLFLSSTGFVMVMCLCLIFTRAATGNTQLILLYSVLGACSTVVNTGITKAVQMTMPHAIKFFLFICYLVLSVVGLGVAALANGSLDDPSLFVPVSSGVQLVLTCIAGLCIWQDGRRLALPLCYSMVYVLIVIGSYLVSSFDTLGNASPQIKQEQVEIVRHVAAPLYQHVSTRSRMSKTMSDTALAAFSESFQDPGALVEDRFSRVARRLLIIMANASDEPLRHMIRRCLKCGSKFKRLSDDDLIDLCLYLMENPDSTLKCDAFKSWLANYTSPEVSSQSAGPLPRQGASGTSLSSALLLLEDPGSSASMA